ncbi:MAG: rhomboid family intramembrane serine protease [Anaerolineaceae bacterium]|nr:rhomboid family intramembrane serine protease [Anaerolineaceae bacterium]
MNNPASNPYHDPVEPPRPSVRLALPRPAENSRVTYIILAVTIFFFTLQWLGSQVLGVDYLLVFGAKINQAIRAGQFWRLLTPALLHASLIHIGFNMYALYIIGRGLEQHYGHGRYLLLYILSTLGGNVFSFLFSPNPSVGASTAIFGLVAAEGVFIFRNRSIFGGNTRAMLANILTIIVINLILGLSPGIDNWGHLGGLLGGVAFAWFAGPVLKVEGFYPNLKLVDQHDHGRIGLIAALEILFWASLVFVGLS